MERVCQMINNPGQIKIFARCTHCQKEYDVTRWSMKYGVRCDACEGYVISPSGKVFSRIEGLERLVTHGNVPK